MADSDLQATVRHEIEQALGYFEDTYTADRLKATRYYYGEPLGNEREGRSRVVMTEVSDTIEYLMPSLMRIFTQSDDYVRFVPRGPEDVEVAEQASDYVNFVLNQDNPGFALIHNWIKDALLYKVGVLKHYWDDKIEIVQESYADLTMDELASFIADDDVEVVEQDDKPIVDPETGAPIDIVYDVTIKRRKKVGRVVIENVPPEEFLIERRAKSLEDARFVAQRTTMTVSDLVAMGYDRDEVEEYAGYTALDVDEERQTRFDDLDQNTMENPADPTMREVLVTEAYIYADDDGDGIAELRRVVTLGEGYEIFENELFDRVPFSIVSPILIPHRAIGRGIAEQVFDLQEIKTAVMRQLLDNMYAMNNQRVGAVDGQVNLDDLMNNVPGGVVRMRAPGMVQPISTPSIGGEAFQTLQYVDTVRESRTGLSKAAMGLDADALQSTTAVAVNATVTAAQGKVEMIARVIAEAGMKPLFKSLLHLITKHQDRPRMIRLRGAFVEMDPRNWSPDYDVTVNVGLGSGQTQEKMQMLSSIAAKQEQILMQLGENNGLVTGAQYLTTLRKMVELGGWKDANQFFNAPSEMQQIRAQQQGQQQQQPSPEMMKVQAEVQADQQKLQAQLAMDQQKLAAQIELDKQKAIAQLRLDRAKAEAEMGLKRDELNMEAELEAIRTINGMAAGNANIPRPE